MIKQHRTHFPAFDFVPKWVSGRYYDSIAFIASYSANAFGNTASGCIFAIPNAVTLTTLGIEVTTLAAGGFLRLALYNADSESLWPTTLLYQTDAATLQTDSTGFKSVNPGLYVRPGWYWGFVACTLTATYGLRTASVSGNTLQSFSVTDPNTVSGAGALSIGLSGFNPVLANVGFPKTFFDHSHTGSVITSGQHGARIMLGV